jgi:CDP-diglyceride synthetase
MAFVYFGYFLAHLSLLFSVTALETQKETAEKLAVVSLQLSPGYFFFMLYGTATADLVGWLLGPRLGSHPLAARVSPDTTVERAIVTLAWAFLWSFTLGWTLPQPAFNWIAMLISAILFGIMGPLGDLVMRYILHDLGLTQQADGAEYVPYRALGHLNRLIFVAPLFFRLVRYVELHHGTLEIPIRS